jgi:hypothetical protein
MSLAVGEPIKMSEKCVAVLVDDDLAGSYVVVDFLLAP